MGGHLSEEMALYHIQAWSVVCADKCHTVWGCSICNCCIKFVQCSFDKLSIAALLINAKLSGVSHLTVKVKDGTIKDSGRLDVKTSHSKNIAPSGLGSKGAYNDKVWVL